jgi:hypothetical protein
MTQPDKTSVAAVRELLDRLAGRMKRGEVSLEVAAEMIIGLLPSLQRSSPGRPNPGRLAEERRA